MAEAAKAAFDIFCAVPDLARKIVVWRDQLKDLPEEHTVLDQEISIVFEKFDKLCEIISSSSIEANLQEDVKLICSTRNPNFSEISQQLERVISKYNENVRRSKRWRDKLFLKVWKDRITCITTDVKEISASLSSMLSEIRKVKEKVYEEQGRFTSTYMVPRNVGPVVIDFQSRTNDGKRVTCEGRLLDAVLSTGESGTVVVFVSGEGGVGKTFALRQVGLHHETVAKYTGGVLYFTMGQEAGLDQLVKKISIIVQRAGAKRSVNLILENDHLDEVVQIAGEWFAYKPCLFLIDDIWCVRGISPETIKLLRKLAVHHESRIVLTTRDNHLRCEANDVKVHFRHRDQSTSRKMLLVSAAQEEPQGHEARQAIDKLLKKCDGVPLALNVVGGGVRYLAEYHFMQHPEDGWAEYLLDLDDDSEGVTVKVKDLLYRSLKFIDNDESGNGERRRLHQERFESLCILRKAQFIRISVAAKLWNTSESDARKEAKMLERHNIVRLLYRTGEAGKRDSFMIGLHDLMLDVAQAEMRSRNLEVDCAIRLIHRYLTEVATIATNSCATVEGLGIKEQSTIDPQGFRDKWLLVKDDNYISSNICWLLLKAKMHEEIQWLMTKPRWVIRQWEEYGSVQLLEDLDVAFESLISNDDASEEKKRWLQILRSAVRLSKGDVVSSSWNGMAWFQLYGRLAYYVDPDIQLIEFVREIERDSPKPWLKPGPGVFVSAGGALLEMRKFGGELLCQVIAKNEFKICYQEKSGDIFMYRNDLESGEDYSPEIIWQQAPHVSKAVISGDGTTIVFRLESGDVDVWKSGQKGKIRFARTECRNVEFLGLMGMSKTEERKYIDRVCKSSNIAISSDGKRLILAFSDGVVELWEERNEVWTREKCMLYQSVVRVGMSGDGNFVVIGNTQCVVGVWKLLDGIWKMEMRSNARDWVEVIQERRYLVLQGGWDLTIWELPSSLQLSEVMNLSVNGMAMNSDGSRIAIGRFDGGLEIRNVEDWTVENVLFTNGFDVEACVNWYNKDILISFSKENRVGIWDVRNSEGRAVSKDCDNCMRTVNISDDGKRVLLFLGDDPILIWDYRDGIWMSKKLTESGQMYRCVAMSNDGMRLIAGRKDGIVQIWLHRCKWESTDYSGHSCMVTSVAISADGNRAVTGSDDKTIRIWDYRDEGWKSTVILHETTVTGVAISGGGGRVLSWGWANIFQVWELRHGNWEEIIGHGGEEAIGHGEECKFKSLISSRLLCLNSVVMSDDGNRVAEVCSNGCDVWNIQSKHWKLEGVVTSEHVSFRAAFGGENDQPLLLRSSKEVCELKEGRWVSSGPNEGACMLWPTPYENKFWSHPIPESVKDICKLISKYTYRVKNGYLVEINGYPFFVWIQEII